MLTKFILFNHGLVIINVLVLIFFLTSKNCTRVALQAPNVREVISIVRSIKRVPKVASL